MDKIILLTSFSIFTSLAYADIKIDSSVKRANVYQISKDGARQLLGQTPLILEANSVGTLLVEKPSYVPSHVLVPPGVENMELKVELKPLTDWSPEYLKYEASRIADKALDRIIQAQTFIDERKTSSARPIIDSLMHDYPSSVAVKILHANWLAVSGNASEALDVYKSINADLSPTDKELKSLIDKMVQGLEKIVVKRRGA